MRRGFRGIKAAILRWRAAPTWAKSGRPSGEPVRSMAAGGASADPLRALAIAIARNVMLACTYSPVSIKANNNILVPV